MKDESKSKASWVDGIIEIPECLWEENQEQNQRCPEPDSPGEKR